MEPLRTAGSESLVPESLFNKVTILTAWRAVTLLERDSSTGISLWSLGKFLESSFAQHLQAPTSDIMLFFFVLFLVFADQWGLQPKKHYLAEQWYKSGEGTHKPAQFSVVMEISWKPHVPNTHSKKKRMICKVSFNHF